MKKVLASILVIVYLCSSVGATVHLHYCMDQLVNWSLNDEGEKCKNCGMEKDGDCCKDEHKFVKNSSDQSIAGTIQLIKAPAIEPHISFINIPDNYSFTFMNGYPVTHAPPFRSGADIHILNNVFRI